MKTYVRKTPEIVRAEQISEEKYDGYVTVCAYHLDTLLFIDERRYEEKYRDADFLCDYEDDGHCMKGCGGCEHARRIGYIKMEDYRLAYPVVGDYKVVDENGNINFMREEQFQSKYEIVEK